MASNKKFSAAQQAMVCRQLALLTATGLTLPESLKALAEERETTPVNRAVAAINSEVERGNQAGEALTRNLSQLQGLPPALFKQGSEQLSRVFRQIAEFADKKQELRRIFRNSSIYPAAIAGVMVLVVLLLSVVVIPMLASMFADMGQSLPLPTRIVIGVSNFLKGWGGLFLIVLFSTAVAGLCKNSKLVFGILDKTPAIGRLNRSIAATEYLKTAILLLQSGLSLREALTVAADSVTNTYYAEKLKRLAEQGNDAAAALSNIQNKGLIPSIVGLTLRTGDRSGAALPAFIEAADYMERETDLAYTRFSSLLPPLMIIFIGCAVGFVIIAMYMPIFQMGSAV